MRYLKLQSTNFEPNKWIAIARIRSALNYTASAFAIRVSVAIVTVKAVSIKRTTRHALMSFQSLNRRTPMRSSPSINPIRADWDSLGLMGEKMAALSCSLTFREDAIASILLVAKSTASAFNMGWSALPSASVLAVKMATVCVLIRRTRMGRSSIMWLS